jgi:hypothetical protein
MSEYSVAVSGSARDDAAVTPDEFVLAIKKADGAVSDTLKNLAEDPPGRRSHPRGSVLSRLMCNCA